jgi:hypothetical protein
VLSGPRVSDVIGAVGVEGTGQRGGVFPGFVRHTVTWLEVIVPIETDTFTTPFPAKLSGTNTFT